MPYQEILKRAWQIFKRQRALWLFGFLSACTGGAYGRLNLPTFNFRMPFAWEGHSSAQPMPPEMFRYLEHLPRHISPTVAVLVALAVAILILLWMVVLMAVRALAEPVLLRGALADIRGSHPLSVGEAFRLGKPFFLRTFGFYLLIGGGAAALGFLLIAVLAVIAVVTVGIGLLCLIPLLLLAIPLLWLLEIYFEMAVLALVLEERSVWEAFSRGWEVLRSHFWDAVLMGLLLTAIHIGASLALGVVFLVWVMVAGTPLLALGLALQATGGLLWGLIILGVFTLLLVLLLIALANGLVQTYIQSAWVLAYLHFTVQPEAETTVPPAPPTAEQESPPPTADANDALPDADATPQTP